MSILDVEFVEELVDACQYFWSAGWGEYHAGNIRHIFWMRSELKFSAEIF